MAIKWRHHIELHPIAHDCQGINRGRTGCQRVGSLGKRSFNLGRARDSPSTERQTRQRHPEYPRSQALRRHHLRHELSRGVSPESRDEVAGEDEREVIMRRQIDTKFLSLYRLVRRVSG